MKRDVIEINQDLCIGCGLCVNTCHQGALELIDGKATLVSEDYCDGLGRCLPNCPTGALQIVQKEVTSVKEKGKENAIPTEKKFSGCPGSMARGIGTHSEKSVSPTPSMAGNELAESQLTNWPLQLGLVSVNAPYLEGAHLLIAADCTAFAYAGIQNDFIKGRVCLIGCPKLDTENYSDKLTEIIKNNNIASITVLRMEVPCCAGIVTQVTTALGNSGKVIPWGYKIISLEGKIIG